MASPYLLLLLLLFPGVPLALLLLLFFIVRPKPTRVPLRSRHVFITGGSSGIGLALASYAAAQGAKVTILARSQQKLDEARDQIRLSTGSDVIAVSADVRDFDAVKKAVEEAEGVNGPVGVLVCSHGVFIPAELEKVEIEEFRFQVDVNLIGTFNVVKAVLPAMKKASMDTRGSVPASIAIISSQAGQVGIYSYTAYSASKFALRGFAEALQHEVIADNIRVSLVFPPDTETPGLEEEKKRRTELLSKIVESSGGMKAEEVAKISWDGIQSGTFIISCNFEGLMLSIATAGLSPQSSFLTAFMEVLGAGFMRFVGLCFQWNWFNIIEKWHAKNRNN